MVGKTRAEVSNLLFVETEFYNYLGEKIDPVTINVTTQENTNSFDINTIQSNHTIGRREGGPFNSFFYIENGNMKIRAGINSTSEEILEVYHLMINSLTTNEKSYTKFKFIQ